MNVSVIGYDSGDVRSGKRSASTTMSSPSIRGDGRLPRNLSSTRSFILSTSRIISLPATEMSERDFAIEFAERRDACQNGSSLFFVTADLGDERVEAVELPLIAQVAEEGH